VPVWHEATAKWVRDGKLVLLGVTQEQHPDRCRLLAQWKGFDWPILHDPINVLRLSAVPVFVAIDEKGIVRDVRPRLERFEADFLTKDFRDEAPGVVPRLTPVVSAKTMQPDFDALRAKARKDDTPTAWRELGDALVLWGGDGKIDASLDAYEEALRRAPKDGPTLFRLGVCYRRRYESIGRKPGDFQTAVDHWGRALALEPNEYVWRRRIQQYGPRLDKPYAFYDWVEEAEKAIRRRGEQPVALKVRPGGAEIAHPAREFPTHSREVHAPDPEGKITRDRDGWIRADVTVVPARARPGQAVRVHVTLRPDPKHKAHWDNEAGPPQLWIDPPEGGQTSDRLLTAAATARAVSDEERTLDFEVKVPKNATGTVRFAAYATYHVCDDEHGQCRFLRLDVPILVPIGE
jgi:hypothetical protein